MDRFKDEFSINSLSEDHIDGSIQPQMPCRIEARPLHCLQLSIVSLPINNLASLVDIGFSIDPNSLLYKKQVRNLKKNIENEEYCQQDLWPDFDVEEMKDYSNHQH